MPLHGSSSYTRHDDVAPEVEVAVSPWERLEDDLCEARLGQGLLQLVAGVEVGLPLAFHEPFHEDVSAGDENDGAALGREAASEVGQGVV